MGRAQALVTEALEVLERSPALGVDAALRAACARIAHAPAARRLAESTLAALTTRKEPVR